MYILSFIYDQCFAQLNKPSTKTSTSEKIPTSLNASKYSKMEMQRRILTLPNSRMKMESTFCS